MLMLSLAIDSLDAATKLLVLGQKPAQPSLVRLLVGQIERLFVRVVKAARQSQHTAAQLGKIEGMVLMLT